MEKEMVQKFDLEAAFKALDEIDTPKAKGLRANRVNLTERFTTKGYGEELVEDYYNINDHEALEEAKEDREAEVAKAKLARIEKIVDLDAQTEEDLLPSYVGKVIIQCPQCMTLFYKNPEDIEKSEENPDVVNINEICQHCGNASGYTLIGKVDTVGEDEAANYEAAEEGTEEDELNLDFGEPTEEVSPEGTGGGFEEEEVVFEEGSEDSSDDELDLTEIDLESEAPVDESIQREQLNEEVKLEDDTIVETKAEDILDAAAEAGKEVAKEVEADLTKAEVKEITDEVVVKELDIPVVEEGSDDSSDDELKEALSPEEIEQKLTAYAASLGVEEGYTGNPAERTTHLEYTDDDPTNGKAVLPDNIEKQLTEEIEISKQDYEKLLNGSTFQGKPTFGKQLKAENNKYFWLGDEKSLEAAHEYLKPLEECGDKTTTETPLTEGQYDVSDADFKAMLNNKVFQEFGEALTEEKVEEAKINTAAVEKAVNKINAIGAEEVEEDINITNNDSPGRVDNRQMGSHEETKSEEHVEEGILSAVDNVVDGVVDGVKSILASDEAEKKDIKEEKADEGLGLLGIGDVNVNLDASGQNNAVGFGGGEGKNESCEGHDCREEKHVCEKCGKEPCECKDEGLLPGLDSLPSLPGLDGLPGLSEKCEDLHEESLNKHISDYLTEVYANVKDFQAADCSFRGNTLVVEGTINFNSGKSRTTKFEFTESKDSEAGKIILEGYNKDLAEDAHFTLNCLLEDSGKCLVTESFGYKYTINNTLVEGLK